MNGVEEENVLGSIKEDYNESMQCIIYMLVKEIYASIFICLYVQILMWGIVREDYNANKQCINYLVV